MSRFALQFLTRYYCVRTPHPMPEPVFRLRFHLTRKHTCVCGEKVDPFGYHGLSCREAAARGRQRRHAQVNEVLVRALRAADVRAELKPSLMQRDDGKRRPDGATLDPWTSGRIMVWDFTCPDTLAASYVNQSAASAGSIAARAEQNKRTKYVLLMQSEGVLFTPIAIETLGTWGPAAVEICKEIGSRLAIESGDPRSLFFLKQRLGLAVQRGNAASISGTAPTEEVLL